MLVYNFGLRNGIATGYKNPVTVGRTLKKSNKYQSGYYK